MGKIYYSEKHPDNHKKNICVFRINSELEIAVAKLFLSKLEPKKDNPMKGVGSYGQENKGFFDVIHSILNGSSEICFQFIRQVINSETNLTKLINDNFSSDEWAFCVVSTVNIRSLINADEYNIYDIYVDI